MEDMILEFIKEHFWDSFYYICVVVNTTMILHIKEKAFS